MPSAKGAFPRPPPHAKSEDAHPFCFVCSPLNPFGLSLRFKKLDDGSVIAAFVGHPTHEGYRGMVHGGIVATLLDGAMTQCLFADGIRAPTAELKVRFRHPMALGEQVRIRAWRLSSVHRLHLMRAEISVGPRVLASAQGKFLEPHE